MLRMDRALAEKHYAIHKGKAFFSDLINYITSGPIIAAVLEGERAIEAIRQTMGATDPLKAVPGSIRGDFGLNIQENLVHGSDSPESAEKEISLFFSAEELINW
jgi:nucleoside-diphosphate kinase